MACREEEILAVGDSTLYDIAGTSIVVVRTAPDVIKAYYNACLHRGRPIRDYPGNLAELRCPYHGFAWSLDGELQHIPCQWDFPHVKPGEWRLPELQVGTWGGFVFVNMDPKAEPLETYLGDLTWHFRRWPLEDRYKQAHVAKILPLNWKAAQEAFMESYHVVTTHPELLPTIGDANSQYDAFGNFSRAITANATPSPHLAWEPTQQEILDAMMDRRHDDPAMFELPEGMQARAMAAMAARMLMQPTVGEAVAELCDSELLDSFYFTVFPNFHPWGAYNRIVYRFRPNGNDHTTSIMECMYLAPFQGERPPPAEIHWLTEADDWTAAPELGLLARVFNQDSFNLNRIREGLRTTRKKTVTLGRYQETKVRHFYHLYDQVLSEP
jgi:phenylpropionate dioxygenase-like ring-hydroxylating dioxygenase large terminal subunit